jgi:hypothetical protein
MATRILDRHRIGRLAVAPLERLFALEVEFHGKLRREALGNADIAAVHTSYALQSGYEPLLRSIGRVTAQDIERLTNRLTVTGNARDVLAARDSLTRLFGLRKSEA